MAKLGLSFRPESHVDFVEAETIGVGAGDELDAVWVRRIAARLFTALSMFVLIIPDITADIQAIR